MAAEQEKSASNDILKRPEAFSIDSWWQDNYYNITNIRHDGEYCDIKCSISECCDKAVPLLHIKSDIQNGPRALLNSIVYSRNCHYKNLQSRIQPSIVPNGSSMQSTQVLSIKVTDFKDKILQLRISV